MSTVTLKSLSPSNSLGDSILAEEIIYFLSISFDRKNYFCNFEPHSMKNFKIYPKRITFMDENDLNYFRLCFGNRLLIE